MLLLLTEADVRELLNMPLALEAVENVFRRLADGAALVHPRRRLHLEGFSYLHYMAAVDGAGGYEGLKIYTSSRHGLRFILPLFRAKTGELVAIIEASYLGQMRTGAATGLATKLLAREGAKTVGIIGTGLQARTQLEAIVAVRKIERIYAFGRDANRREAFAREMTAALSVPVKAAATAEALVREAEILVTATTAKEPVVKGSWIQHGTHINAIGANFPQNRELDSDTVARADAIFVDSCEQSKMEAGDLIHAFRENPNRWDDVKELAQLVGGKIAGRTSREQITLFKSNGIAIQDITTAGRVYELALQRNVGKRVNFWGEDEARTA
ncbi:MAG TPA: ornithine cyclodeaminase family protein [Candidatus Acidoferrales bacterium]|nr:ornithine cyclodeaminase family protein [Candidatus Acidoferrales bacterium]